MPCQEGGFGPPCWRDRKPSQAPTAGTLLFTKRFSACRLVCNHIKNACTQPFAVGFGGVMLKEDLRCSLLFLLLLGSSRSVFPSSPSKL